MGPAARAVLAVLLLLPACSSPRDDRFSVFLVVVDTLRADHVGAYGHSLPTTPRLDALAAEGLVFERAYSHSSWTLPAFGSLFTGLYPSEHGALRVQGEWKRSEEKQPSFGVLRADAPTLAELYGAAGFRTGAFVNNMFLRPDFGLARGFERYDWVNAGNSRHRSAGDTVDAALAWLDQGRGAAFAVVHLFEPHTQYAPPPSTRHSFTAGLETAVQVPFAPRDTLLAMIEGDRVPTPAEQDHIRRLYDEEVLAADQAIGRWLDGLAARGLRERSWIFVTSDHGEEFWEHGSFEHGHSLHGELIRVPLIAVGPGLEPARIRTPVQHADLHHTLAALAGTAAQRGEHGRDLLDLARRERLGETPPGRAILSEETLHGTRQAALSSERFRLVADLERGGARLWRLDQEGQETEEVAAGDPDDRLRPRMLAALLTMRGSILPDAGYRAKADLSPEEVEELRALGYVR